MKSAILLPTLIVLSFLKVFGQNPEFELIFTAIDNSAYVQMDSIKILNRSQGVDTILYWPDTVLALGNAGIPESLPDHHRLKVFQNHPNPVIDQSTISMYIPEKDKVEITISDFSGRVLLKTHRVMDRGDHSFRFIPGIGKIFLFTIKWRNEIRSIKILHTSQYSKSELSLEYIDSKGLSNKSIASEDIQKFSFNKGDDLLFIAFNDTLQSGIAGAPENSRTYTFQFASNFPCPGTPTVSYEGKVYKTVQIFSQCWMKENLDVGTLIHAGQNMRNNGIIEKYCYNDIEDSCSRYGGLYQWDEMMQYTILKGAQGICPPNWHLPADEEWKILSGAADSKQGIGDNTWDAMGSRGFDAGSNLKSTSGWKTEGNGIDLFGFSGLPGGVMANSEFYYAGYCGYWWTSKVNYSDYMWRWYLDYIYTTIDRNSRDRERGLSVRCVKNE